MLRYATKPKSARYAKAYGRNLDTSVKDAAIVCRTINNLQVQKAAAVLEGLISGKRDIRGKYYTKTVKLVLDILNSALENARFKGLDEDKLHVNASGHKGFETYTGRRNKMKEEKRRYSHVQVVLLER